MLHLAENREEQAAGQTAGWFKQACTETDITQVLLLPGPLPAWGGISNTHRKTLYRHRTETPHTGSLSTDTEQKHHPQEDCVQTQNRNTPHKKSRDRH